MLRIPTNVNRFSPAAFTHTDSAIGNFEVVDRRSSRQMLLLKSHFFLRATGLVVAVCFTEQYRACGLQQHLLTCLTRQQKHDFILGVRIRGGRTLGIPPVHHTVTGVRSPLPSFRLKFGRPHFRLLRTRVDTATAILIIFQSFP